MDRDAFIHFVLPFCVLLTVTSGCTPMYLVFEGRASCSTHDVVPGKCSELTQHGVTGIRIETDSQVVAGALLGAEFMDSSSYAPLWVAWATPLGIELRPGDSVNVERRDLLRGPVSGRFSGISEWTLHLQSDGEDLTIPVRSIRVLHNGNRVFTGEELERIVVNTPPPALVCLEVKTSEGTRLQIPADQIRGGEYLRSFDATGLFFTVPIDFVIAFALARGFGRVDLGMGY